MSNSRIDKLKAKKAQIDAQLKAAQARERAQKRKDDTRRKIISGALALEHAQRNPNSEFTQTMLRLIQNGVKADKDRALFDLDPLPQGGTAPTPPPNERTTASKLWKRVTGQ